MKPMNDIELLMKQVASKHEVNPPAFVWENIEVALNESNNRRNIFFWISGAFVLISFIALLGYTGIVKNSQNSLSFEKQSKYIPTENSGTTSDKNYARANNIIAENQEIQNAISLVGGTEKISSKYLNIINKTEANEKVTVSKQETGEKIEPESEDIDSKIINIEHISKLRSALQLPIWKLAIGDKIKCPSFNESKKRMFAELGLLGGMHIKSIGNGSGETLAALRNRSESTWYTWGMYGAIGLNISPSFYIGAGVDWTQSKDKFYHESNAITKMIITFDAATGIPTDTSFVTGKLINKGEIRYNMVDIPLIVGFVKKYDKWDFGLELAPVFNISFSAKGKIFNDQNQISTIANESPVYKSQVGIGLKASLVARRNIADGLSIQIKPTFKTYFYQLNDQNYGIPINYSLFSLNVGVRKDF